MKKYCKCNCNIDQLVSIYNTRVEDSCLECKTYVRVIKPNQGELSEHTAYEFTPIERKDWKPELYPSQVYDDVQSLITTAFQHCGEDAPDFLNLQHYPYTQIMLSPSEPSRISGISWQWLQKKAYDSSFTRISALESRYRGWIECNIPDATRIKFGTYLKPGKLIRALAPGIDDSKVTCIASKLADLLRGNSVDTSRVQVSDTPSEIYSYRTDFQSCMSEQNKEFFQLYDECPTISIAYIMERGKLLGRALLHSNVDVDRGDAPSVKLMDRIYAVDNGILAVFQAWARENGYYTKLAQDRGSTDIVSPDSKVISGVDLSFEYKSYLKYKRVPYLDTFQSYDSSKGVFNSWGYGTSLTNIDGTDSENEMVGSIFRCEHCDCEIDEDDHFHSPDGEDYCQVCYDERVTWCSRCESDEWQDNCVNTHDGETICQRCADRYHTVCEDCGDYCNHNDIIITEDEYNLCPVCVENHYRCDDCGGYIMYHEKSYLTDEGEKILCFDCLDDYSSCKECGVFTKNGDVCENCEEVLAEVTDENY